MPPASNHRTGLLSYPNVCASLTVMRLRWVEQFWSCFDQDVAKAESEQRQLYVAMTKAQDELYLFAGGETRIVQALKASGNFLVL